MADNTQVQSSRSRPVFPLMVQQILTSRNQDFKIAGREVHVAVLVGIVRNIRTEGTEISFDIEDHTGRIKAIIWLETNEEAHTKYNSMKPNQHVKAFGSIKMHNGQKVFSIIQMRPIHSLDVITNHILQAACSKVTAQAEFRKKVSSAATTGAALANALTDEIMVNSTFTPMQEAIINIVKSEHEYYGIAKKNLMRHFPAQQASKVDETLEYLINIGVIYPTIDNNHFKAITTV